MNKKTKNSITCLTVGLITGLFVLLVPWLNNINPDNLLHHLELKSIDFRINTLLKFKKLEKPPEVIVIEVDEETITTNAGLLKNKDISRKVYAELITILNSLGAKTIGFDMLFLKDADPNDPDNKLFIDTISKFDNVVLASKIKGLKNLECYTCQTSFYDYFPEDTYGVANISPDSDGIVRTFNYSYPIKRMNFKSLQEEIFYAPTLATALIQKYKPGLITDKQINEINPDNYYINYKEYGKNRINLPLYDFYSPKSSQILTENMFKNKIVLVGKSHTTSRDLVNTPVKRYTNNRFNLDDYTMPGVELHAIIIETILNNATIKKFHIPLNISIIVALCILLAYIISQSRSFKLSFASTTIIIVVYILFSFILYAFFNRLTLLAIPVIQLLVAAGLATTSSYFLINKERNTIYDSFKRYVSPEVARIASENIQHLQSTRKDITLLFSDIKGFTSISEELDPNLLSYMLNTYLSKMGDIVFKHQGTLDKYIGDAVMAFWGAPIPVSTPEYKACLTAFEMIEAVNELNKMFTVKGIPELQIRIGINTTRAMVGNLGGKSFNYTAIGDGVNLAARLEGANKNFNSSILISHYTYEKIQDKILCRELGTIQVKGKNEPITVFNPICTTEHKNAQSIKEFISYFDQARKLFYIQHYNEALELFKLCLNLIPDDPVTDSFIDSIKHNLSSDN